MRRLLLAAAILFLIAPAQAAETPISGQVFADNWFEMWVNGRKVAEDPIVFTPHNTVEVTFRAAYPMVYAIHAKDFAHTSTGLEYNHTKIGDGGLIAKFSDGTVTGTHWKCLVVFVGPTDKRCMDKDPHRFCKVVHKKVPEGWTEPDFDDSQWPTAHPHTEAAVRPHGNYRDYDWRGAGFIWGEDLETDNTILCRLKVERLN